MDTVARRFCLSGMCREKGLAYGSRAVALPKVPATEFGDGWDIV
jgi:hypothetical protein